VGRRRVGASGVRTACERAVGSGSSAPDERAVPRSRRYDSAFIASLMPSDTPTSFGKPLIAMAASFSL